MLPKKSLLFVAVFALLGCDAPVRTLASCDFEGMRPWILDCVEKANPHADEDPEDYVLQCERTAARLFCGPGCYLSQSKYLCEPTQKRK